MGVPQRPKKNATHLRTRPSWWGTARAPSSPKPTIGDIATCTHRAWPAPGRLGGFIWDSANGATNRDRGNHTVSPRSLQGPTSTSASAGFVATRVIAEMGCARLARLVLGRAWSCDPPARARCESAGPGARSERAGGDRCPCAPDAPGGPSGATLTPAISAQLCVGLGSNDGGNGVTAPTTVRCGIPPKNQLATAPYLFHVCRRSRVAHETSGRSNPVTSSRARTDIMLTNDR
jgi:hypothetical protein